MAGPVLACPQFLLTFFHSFTPFCSLRHTVTSLPIHSLTLLSSPPLSWPLRPVQLYSCPRRPAIDGPPRPPAPFCSAPTPHSAAAMLMSEGVEGGGEGGCSSTEGRGSHSRSSIKCRRPIASRTCYTKRNGPPSLPFSFKCDLYTALRGRGVTAVCKVTCSCPLTQHSVRASLRVSVCVK